MVEVWYKMKQMNRTGKEIDLPRRSMGKMIFIILKGVTPSANLKFQNQAMFVLFKRGRILCNYAIVEQWRRQKI
jgi:hypothetical protein